MLFRSVGGPDGALKVRYHYNELQDILDKIHEIGALPDLRAYHFYNTKGIWKLPDGTKNYPLAREATGELLDTLKEIYGWELEDVVKNITSDRFKKEKIKFGATIEGMVRSVYEDSPYNAIRDYLQNQPDEKVRERFSKLRPYHFRWSQRGTWKKKDGTKNYELAREATGELIETLKERYGWNLEDIAENITQDHFKTEKVIFGATLGGMLARVYDDSARAAISDYLAHLKAKRK